MRRLPPSPFRNSLILTTILVWAVPRAILTTGARAAAARFGISPDLTPLVLVLLAAGVSFIVLLNTTITRERVFAANLGVSRRTILGIALATVVACETAVILFPSLLSRAFGG
jgi:hypothetical protein